MMHTLERRLCFNSRAEAAIKRAKYKRHHPLYWRWNAVMLGDNDFGRQSWAYAERLDNGAPHN
jgi:hypothetical protein